MNPITYGHEHKNTSVFDVSMIKYKDISINGSYKFERKNIAKICVVKN